MRKSIPTHKRKTDFRELLPSRFKKVTFPGGNKDIIKEINVEYEKKSDLVEIKFDDIASKVTKDNLRKLGGIYYIDWEKIIKYPVATRVGYIIEGTLKSNRSDKPDMPVTFVRKELHNRMSGKTELWFDKGYCLSAPKIIRTHETFNEQIEYWGPTIKEETILKWVEITSNKRLLESYKLSNFVYGNKRKKEFPEKYSDDVINWIVSIVKKINPDKRLKLLAAIQKIEFERL